MRFHALRGQIAAPLFALSCAMLLTYPAFASWPVGGARVATGSVSVSRVLSSAGDSAGGAFVIVYYEGAARSNYAVLFRVEPDGGAPLAWPPFLVLASNVSAPFAMGRAAPDLPGTVLTTASPRWDAGTSMLNVERHDGSGAELAHWSIPATWILDFANPIADGAGGYFLVHVTLGLMIGYHLLADSSFDPQWGGAAGKTLATVGQAATVPEVVGDGAGGCFALWTVEEPLYSHVDRLMAIRFGPDGAPSPGWPPEGIHVCPLASNQRAPAVLATPTGLLVAWSDLRNGNLDIFAQHLTRDGTPASGWPADGLLVSARPNNQLYTTLVDDAAGGAIVAWSETNQAGVASIFATHVTASGSVDPAWTPGGVMVADLAVNPASSYFQVPAMAPDRSGGAYFTWIPGMPEEVRARHLAADGSDASGWWPGASIIGFAEEPPMIAATGAHDAIVAWYHHGRRADGSDLGQPAGAYVQRLEPDRVVPVLASVRSVEAASDQVRIAWQVSEAGPAMAVHRRTEGSPWSEIGTATSDGNDQLAFEDRDVVPGGRYGYALGDERIGLVWVDVPVAARFSLGGFTPNPAEGRSPTLSFALDSAAPATLEVFDVAGRRVWSRDVRGAGQRAIALETDRPWAPGVYVAHLRQGGRVLIARGIVLR